FLERCGPTLKLIHLRRAEREASIASLVKNCRYFPAAYGYYSDSPEATVKRPTAFHFGEMSREGWSRLSLHDKLAWYFDKTHALTASYRGLFEQSMEIQTETINAEEPRRRLAEFVLGDASVLPIPAHLNVHFAYDSLPGERRHKLQWLLGRFNV